MRPTPLEGARLAYRPSELASLVGLSTKAIYRAIERGELRAAKVANGTRLLIPARAAADWLTTASDRSGAAERASKPSRKRSDHRPLSDALVQLQGPSCNGSQLGQEGARKLPAG